MDRIRSLEQIRPLWLSRVSSHLVNERIRESFINQLNRFFDLLLQAAESGNPALLDSLLIEWISSRTETEIDQQESSLPPLLNQFFLIIYQASCDMLSEKESTEIFGAILPIYTHAVQFTSTQESQLHVQRITEELINAKVTLERLERSKSDFISVAAHELKTPLTLIEGYASMIYDVLPEGNKRSQADLYLKGIKAGTGRLREIVDDMIDVSLIDNDLLSLNFQPIWLNRLLNLVERELAETINQRKLNFTINPFPGSDEMIFGDGERLYQAFRNVITNGIKYTPDGGKITVDGRLLPGFVETIITDTGIGIDIEDHTRIFEKFGRIGNVSLHSSGKTKFKGGGPGLGLPITKGIIEAHGGTIWVESDGFDEINLPGSTFHILLPLRKLPPDDKTAKLFRPLVEGDKR